MGLFSGLFSAGPKKLTSTQSNTPWSGVSPYLENMYSQASALPTQQYYGGQTYADFNPLQQQSMQGMLAGAGQLQSGVVNPANQAWQSMLGATDVANNPQVQGMLNANQGNVTDALTKSWLPKINTGAIAYGDYGGSGHGKAQQMALENASTQLGRANAGVLSDAYGQGLQAQQSALGYAPQMAELGFMAPRIQGQVGAMQQDMAQQGIDEQMARHMFNQQAPYDRLMAQNQLYSSGLGFGTTAGTQDNPNRRQPFMDLLGVGLAGASMFGGGR